MGDICICGHPHSQHTVYAEVCMRCGCDMYEKAA